MDIFENCHTILNLISNDQEEKARKELIRLLDHHKINDIAHSPLVNHLIRLLGLYPYMQTTQSIWQDKYIREVFEYPIGDQESCTFHREQSEVLKFLLEGKNVLVSAPTSFGKSFVIDALIAIKEPNNVVIIVPTIALANETRRRLNRKFGNVYEIITTHGVELREKNIFILPQERVFGYLEVLQHIDLLIVDEFYKIGKDYDGRTSILYRAVRKVLDKGVSQKYFLAPNLENISDNDLTNDCTILNKLDFSTVFLELHNTYDDYGSLKGKRKKKAKRAKLLQIINEIKNQKTLIYANSLANVGKLTHILTNESKRDDDLLSRFSEWLSNNYTQDWFLVNSIKNGIGIHTGKLHRSIGQLQVDLFNEENLNIIISTSSLIEGVNTSAQNVIIWSNKNGNRLYDYLTYKNIVGRSGRMFRYFVGKVYMFEPPPKKENIQLDVIVPDDILHDLDKDHLSDPQKDTQYKYRQNMINMLGKEIFSKIENQYSQLMNTTSEIQRIATAIHDNRNMWNGIEYLHSENPNDWRRLLFEVLKLIGEWRSEASYTQIVNFICILSNNWNKNIPALLEELKEHSISIDNFFDLERFTSYKIPTFLNDINILNNIILNKNVDISHFISKLSNVFLPQRVFELEEYGFPRMLSRKIHKVGIIDMENQNTTLHEIIDVFTKLTLQGLLDKCEFSNFEQYILGFFFTKV